MIILISNAGFELKTYRFAVNPLFLKSFLISESSSYIKKIYWCSEPLTNGATLRYYMAKLGKKLFIKLHLTLLFISINRSSQNGNVPYHPSSRHYAYFCSLL